MENEDNNRVRTAKLLSKTFQDNDISAPDAVDAMFMLISSVYRVNNIGYKQYCEDLDLEKEVYKRMLGLEVSNE